MLIMNCFLHSTACSLFAMASTIFLNLKPMVFQIICGISRLLLWLIMLLSRQIMKIRLEKSIFYQVVKKIMSIAEVILMHYSYYFAVFSSCSDAFTLEGLDFQLFQNCLYCQFCQVSNISQPQNFFRFRTMPQICSFCLLLMAKT